MYHLALSSQTVTGKRVNPIRQSALMSVLGNKSAGAMIGVLYREGQEAEPQRQVRQEDISLESKQALDRFLASVERRAFLTARFALGNAEDALDVVQDAMWQLVRSYANRGEQEWGPLFHTILQSRISDSRRRVKVRNRLRVWFGGKDDDDSADPLQNIADSRSPDPSAQLKDKQAMAVLEAAIHKLPPRQQQAFLLRTWEGLDVAQTARAMKCSEGSVKTHYSRAVHSLREQLEGHY
jgi:RNA polymerase sigma-70 factor (ECF subfamily)